MRISTQIADKIWSPGIIFIIVMGIVNAQEDSLQSALNAVNRRQRDLAPGYKNFYAEGGLGRYYAPEDKDELAFLRPENDRYDIPEYLKENEFNHKKRFSSSFREKIDRDKENEKEETAEKLLNRLESESDNENNDEFLDIIHYLYQKYYGKYPELYETPNRPDVKKRMYFSNYYPSLGTLGYDSIGLKKRNRYFESDEPNESPYHLNYPPNEEMFNGAQEEDIEDFLPYYKWNLNPYLKSNKGNKLLLKYSKEKKFPLAKRSNPPPKEQKQAAQSKHLINKETRNLASTDPKVAKELSNIFGITKVAPTDKPKKNDKSNKKKEIQDSSIKHVNNSDLANKINKEKHMVNKETVPNADVGEPLQIKKKSVDWSDYFGYDRKKKLKDDIGNEWLVERYHKAIAMATKRNAEKPTHHNEKEQHSNLKKNDEETKLVEMDLKLKNIEDSIIDEALKYTGAHEGATDSKEIQDIKDKVISRLAAAYSLEKMRQALGEYKMSIAKQRKELQESGKLDDSLFYEEKRVSVPRKEAINEERERTPEGDNNIKCTHGDEDCDEQAYKPPSDILEEQSHWIKGDCPQIEEACNEVAEVLGNYGRILEPACNMHQVCLFCGENSWFAPTRQCNLLFLAKADEVCDGDTECHKIANHSIRYLLDIYRTSQSEQRQECNLSCPNNRR